MKPSNASGFFKPFKNLDALLEDNDIKLKPTPMPTKIEMTCQRLDERQEQDIFKDAMKGNTLEYKGNTASEALLTAVAAGTPPDGGSNYDYLNLWTRGAVLEVLDLVATSAVV